MTGNPYESPQVRSSLERFTRRPPRRWPWHYKIALAIGSALTTMVVLFLLSEFRTLVEWMNQSRFP